MNDIAIRLILEYVEKYLFDPTLNWPREEFEKRSYSRWAAYEIIESIMDHPFEQPIDVIDDFYMRMIIFGRAAEGTKREAIFSCAADAAEEIALMFV
jgi:hypothetical protein